MPEPSNEPARRESQAPDSVQYLEALSSGLLTSPVPDFASTLVTQAEQEAEEDNTRFLRDFNAAEEDEADDRTWLNQRGGRSAARRYTPAQLRELNELEERAQQIIQNEYNGWAPGISEDEEEEPQTIPSLPLSRQADSQASQRIDDSIRERVRIRRWRDHFATQPEEATSRHREYADPPLRHPSRFVENGMASSSPPTESSLRTTAMLQAVRQNTQMSPHSRSQLQRYILDRERMGLEAEDNARQSGNSNQSLLSPSQRRQVQREQTVRHEIQQHRDLLAEHQQHRNYLEEQLRQQQQRYVSSLSSSNANEHRRRRMWTNVPAQTPSANSVSVENTVRYLESLRLCESDIEGLDAADESGLDPEELSLHDSKDLLLDTTKIPAPPMCGWLQPGCVLSGTQHAMPATSAQFHPVGRLATEARTRIRHPTFGTSTARTTSPLRPSSFDSRDTSTLPAHIRERLMQQREQPPPRDAEEERWPVKVSIHGIDYDEMTLSGTMEAFNVPDKLSPTKTSSITTYLEGEIIDFNKVTLQTKSFKADTRVDGIYWRKLPPFSDMKDEATVVKCLLSKEWVEQDLMQNWVLMRWKEKHFVTPSDAHSSLTIAGFYYVSVRRSDGQVEGLYYDPTSTPYQHLSLKPERRTFPAYDLR